MIISKFFFKAPRFEDLIQERIGTDEKVEALLALSIPERTFNLDIAESSEEHSEASMSTVMGFPEVKTKFVLSDLGNYLSTSTFAQKEKSVVMPIKPQVPPHSKTPKKRKAVDNLDLEIFDGLSSSEAIRKLQAIANLGLDKFFANLEAAEGKTKEALLMVEDHKRIAQVQSKMLEIECQRTAFMKKEIEELRMQQGSMAKEIVEDAKKSAAIAILQAKIQLMKPIIGGDFDLAQIEKDCNEWQKILASLTNGSSSKTVEQVSEEKVADDPGVEEGKVEVTDGDDGIHA